MIRECSGIVCVCLRDEDCKRLELPQMVASNSNTQGTAFTVSIEAAHGCTTGVSAKDRVTTIKAAANPNGKPEDLLRPGHVYPLRARSGGVLERRGHTETTVDLTIFNQIFNRNDRKVVFLCESQCLRQTSHRTVFYGIH